MIYKILYTLGICEMIIGAIGTYVNQSHEIFAFIVSDALIFLLLFIIHINKKGTVLKSFSFLSVIFGLFSLISISINPADEAGALGCAFIVITIIATILGLLEVASYKTKIK